MCGMSWKMLAVTLVVVVMAEALELPRQTGARVSSDPCREHTCRAGEQCVVQEITCLQPPCPRLGECLPRSCRLSCPAGQQCRQLSASQQQCAPRVDACGGSCRRHEECLSLVQPCLTPPCRVSHTCVPAASCRGAACAPGVSVGRQLRSTGRRRQGAVVRRRRQGAVARRRRQGAVARRRRQGAVADTRDAPKCLVECAEFEECRWEKPRRCVPPCASVARCVARRPHPCDQEPCGAGQKCVAVPCAAAGGCAGCVPQEVTVSVGGEVEPYCPPDDLRSLVEPAGCPEPLDVCTKDRHCLEDGRKCCSRGCGRACVPACTRACHVGEECRLVQVACISAPCPAVAQCVATQATASIAPPSGVNQFLPPPPPPPPVKSQRPAPPVSAGIPDIAAPPIAPHFVGPSRAAAMCGGRRCHVDEVCRPEWCARGVHCGLSGQPPRMRCVPRRPQRPGTCPLNERASFICFDQRPSDQCSSDFDCAEGRRCCVQDCTKLCVPACDCDVGLVCRLVDGAAICRLPRQTSNSRRRKMAPPFKQIEHK